MPFRQVFRSIFPLESIIAAAVFGLVLVPYLDAKMDAFPGHVNSFTATLSAVCAPTAQPSTPTQNGQPSPSGRRET